MFERPRSGERAVLVHIGVGRPADPEEQQEFEELALSAGADIVGRLGGQRRAPHPRLFIGSGKAEELGAIVASTSAEVVVFNHELSPSQERNLEREVRARVMGRTGLILDIFAQRARSHEGKLQVELAQLRHLSTRLVRGWTHLERQKGGIGLRGPGETQLETDRRLLAARIKTLRARLGKVARQRDQGRRNRVRSGIPTVTLVGYTNAGKSTLFNALTSAEVFAADKLFATLDPTLRRLDIGDGTSMVLADTVGFVHDLPHELVAAFKSTLEETREARLLLHVIDAADPRREERRRQVNEVLREIGAGEVPQLEVFNKIDLTGDEPRTDFDDSDGHIRRVWVSAEKGLGLQRLREALANNLAGDLVSGTLRLAPAEGRVRARLFELGAVRRERACAEGGWELDLELAQRDLNRMCRREGLDPSAISLTSLAPPAQAS